MSLVYRRPPDFRFIPVAVAVLFGGSPPVADDPPLARKAEQERFYATVRKFRSPILGGSALAVPLFPVLLADDPLAPRFDETEAYYAGIRPYAMPAVRAPFNPALFEVVASPESPPYPLYAGDYRLYAQKPSHSSQRFAVPLIEQDTIFSKGFEQELFYKSVKPDFISRIRVNPPIDALSNPEVVDNPPQERLKAQRAFHTAFRPPWERPPFYGIPEALFPVILPDDPPITGVPAQSAYWRAFRFPALRPAGGSALSFNLFPAVTVDDPPLGRLTAQEIFWAGYGAPWFDFLRTIRRTHADLLHIASGSGTCDLTEVLARLTVIDASIALIQLTVDQNQSLINTMQTGINTIIASLSGTISIQTGQSDDIMKAIRALERRVQLLQTATEKNGLKS